MTKLLPAAAFLLLTTTVALSMRASAPAQGAAAGQQGLEARVATLESELKAEKKKNDETRALLEQTLAYLDKQMKSGQTLVGALDQCEQQGFAVGENWQSRQTLLAGIRAYCGDQQTGLPKATATAPAKPVAPARPARQ